MYRTVRQARIVSNFFYEKEYSGKKPKAINSDKFIKFIAQAMQWNLVFRTIPDMLHLRGMILKNETDPYNKKSLILVSEKNNACWMRFTAIKESCHLFLEYEENESCDNALEMAQALVLQTRYMPDFLPDDYNYNVTLSEQIKSTIAIDSDIVRDDKSSIRKGLYAEHEAAAIVAAIEIMIPECHKSHVIELHNSLDLNDIAKIFKVPALILEYRLNGWGIK